MALGCHQLHDGFISSGSLAPDWQFILSSFNISNLGVEAVIPDIVQLSILTYFQATSLKICILITLNMLWICVRPF